MLMELGVLGLTLDLGRNRIVAGRLEPYAGCAETTATGTFIAPAVSSSTRADRGNWRITRTG
jgi:hypothetical protein